MQGRVISLSGGAYKVHVDGKEIICKASGRLRNVRVDESSSFAVKQKFKQKIETSYMKLSPKVGDLVEVDLDNQYIIDIFERRNEMIRPNIANVDQIILICSAKEPDFSFYLLDLFLVNIEHQSIKAIIVVSKIDLLNNEELNKLKHDLSYYEKLGYNIFYVDSKTQTGVHAVGEVLHDKISVLAGQTGAGKSSFINALLPGFDLQTNEISKALNRGKHTTRVTSLYEAYGGYIGDTPGFSKLDLSEITDLDIREAFTEFHSQECRFKDCLHLPKSKDCQIINDVEKGKIMSSRYDNYIKMILDRRG